MVDGSRLGGGSGSGSGSGSSEGGSLFLSCSLTTSSSTSEARCKPKGLLDGCDWRSLKMTRTEATVPPPFDRVFSDGEQMLSFSATSKEDSYARLAFDGDLPSYHPSPPSSTPKPYLWNAGLYYSGNGVLARVKGPFTPSQWLELEHQALVYKYIVANVPIPPHLLTPIHRSLVSSGISCFSAGSFVGWGSFYSGCSVNVDPEPGRCRRTDGKKWRCSRDAVADQKYCERHINRGRRRSRKHVEGQSKAMQPVVASPSQLSASPVSGSRQPPRNLRASQSQTKTAAKSAAAGDPRSPPFDTMSLSKENTNDQVQDWSKTQSDCSTFSWPEIEDLRSERTQFESEADQRRASNWIPISWEASMGGPLGEALCSSSASLYLLSDFWDDSIPPVESKSSPTGVLQKTSLGSLTSSTVSSPRTESKTN